MRLFYIFIGQLSVSIGKFCLNLSLTSGRVGESIPIRLFLAGYEMTPTMRDINKKFSVRYYLNLVLIDEEERRYFKQQASWNGRRMVTVYSKVEHLFNRGVKSSYFSSSYLLKTEATVSIGTSDHLM